MVKVFCTLAEKDLRPLPRLDKGFRVGSLVELTGTDWVPTEGMAKTNAASLANMGNSTQASASASALSSSSSSPRSPLVLGIARVLKVHSRLDHKTYDVCLLLTSRRLTVSHHVSIEHNSHSNSSSNSSNSSNNNVLRQLSESYLRSIPPLVTPASLIEAISGGNHDVVRTLHRAMGASVGSVTWNILSRLSSPRFQRRVFALASTAHAQRSGLVSDNVIRLTDSVYYSLLRWSALQYQYQSPFQTH